MPRPKGIPKTGGRVKGSVNKSKRLRNELGKTAIEVTPLQFMLNVMRGTAIPKRAPPAVKAQLIALQFDAAKAAAPYVHARLAAIITQPPPGDSGANLPITPEQLPAPLELARRIAFTLESAAREQDSQ